MTSPARTRAVRSADPSTWICSIRPSAPRSTRVAETPRMRRITPSASWATDRCSPPPITNLSVFRLDQSVAAIGAPIDDVDFEGLGVAEHEERVPEQLHLHGGLVGRRRLHLEALAAVDLDGRGARFAVPRLLGQEPRAQGRFGGSRRLLLPAPRHDPPPLDDPAAKLADLLVQFVDHAIDGNVHILTGLLTPEDDAVPPERHLDDSVPAGVRLDAQQRLDLLHLLEVMREPLHLLRHPRP